MRDDLLIEHMKAALRSLEEMSADEWFAEMEAAGILDKDGNVLRRMPEQPDEAANGAAASARKPRKKPATRRKQSGKPKAK